MHDYGPDLIEQVKQLDHLAHRILLVALAVTLSCFYP